jgi:hypothetical protein
MLIVTGACLSAGLGACGSADRPRRPTAEAVGQHSPAFRGDGDFDQGDNDRDNSWDEDKDAAFDYYRHKDHSWNRGVFHDRDDAEQVGFGHSADSTEAQAISRIVERYYRAAARDDGRGACAMLLPSVAKIVADYRLTPIPYLRGSRTCRVAMKRLFRHEHLSVPAVTSMRIEGNLALALWGSKTMPAGYTTLERRHATWAITAPVGFRLL